MQTVPVHRGVGEAMMPSGRRVILKRFFPSRIPIAERIIGHVYEQTDEEASNILYENIALFAERHTNLEKRFLERFEEVSRTMANDKDTKENTRKQLVGLSEAKKMLIGTMFMHEYAIEGAALFNPSIVPHPDHPVAGPGEVQRVIISLRSCGEGHISSISFREGIISADGRIVLEPNVYRNLEVGQVRRCKASDWNDEDPSQRGCETYRNPVTGHEFTFCDGVFSVRFDKNTPLSARVLFPQTPSQSNGIEDVRFVRFVDDDGSARYYGTLTAYDGRNITPQLVETPDFTTFTMHILEGDIQNKGMALFPRKIKGKYYMMSRQDDVNVFIMESDNVLKWDKPHKITEPVEPWEWFKMGNCGSPVETKYGWLVVTHAVGPLRRYCLGAVMLDLDDPRKVIGRLRKPLMEPSETERDGYVPNVVYTCGTMANNSGCLMMPYAVSDTSSGFATVAIDDIAAAMDLTKGHTGKL